MHHDLAAQQEPVFKVFLFYVIHMECISYHDREESYQYGPGYIDTE